MVEVRLKTKPVKRQLRYREKSLVQERHLDRSENPLRRSGGIVMRDELILIVHQETVSVETAASDATLDSLFSLMASKDSRADI